MKNFIYVMGIVEALIRASYFKQAVGKEMNIASGQETNIQDMAKLINELRGIDTRIVKVDWQVWDTKKRLLVNLDQD
jgi:nucleoside-diphosphate-sugar epimerase